MQIGSAEAAISAVGVDEAFLRVCEIERKQDLLRHTVEGWAVWPLLRSEVLQLLTATPFPNRPMMRRGETLLLALSDLPRLPGMKGVRHFVKTYSSGLSEKRGERYVDIWFDDVILSAGSTFKLEAVVSRFSARSRRAMLPRNLSNTLLDIGASLLSRRRPSPEISAASSALAHALREDFNLESIEDAWVLQRIQRFSASKRVYSALLRRLQPKFVLVVDSGEHALVAAAKEQGSVVLELQHGITHRSHGGDSWTSYARRYRAIMPVPDRLLLYGEYWRRELDSGSFWGQALRVVGNTRIDQYRGGTANRSGDTCTVVFSTQGLDRKNVAEFLAASLWTLRSRVPMRLIVKLHPFYDADKSVYFDALSSFGDQVEIWGGAEGPSTFELLRRANLHVSISSATHYDAIGLGTPTAILAFPSHEVVLPLASAGHAMMVRTPQDLCDLVLAWRELRVPDNVSEYYYKPGALANIRRELDLPVPHEMQGP